MIITYLGLKPFIHGVAFEAKKAAGDKDVQIIDGANSIQQCLNARLCDELQIDVMPVLLGKELRLFEHIDTQKLLLERIKVDKTTFVRTTRTFPVVE